MSKRNQEQEITRRFEAKQEIARQRAQRAPKDNRIFLTVALGVILVTAIGQILYFGSGDSPAALPEDSVEQSTGSSNVSPEEVPNASISESRDWRGEIVLNNQPLEVTMFGAQAPQAVANFVTLSEQGFYQGMECHRLVTDGIYVLQCGDPAGDGTGGPGYTWGPIENAPEGDLYPAGSIAMARAGNLGDSMGSQFFVVYEDSVIPSDVAGGYTIMGQVDNGLETVIDIAAQGTTDSSNDGTPVEPVILNSVEIQ